MPRARPGIEEAARTEASRDDVFRKIQKCRPAVPPIENDRRQNVREAIVVRHDGVVPTGHVEAVQENAGHASLGVIDRLVVPGRVDDRFGPEGGKLRRREPFARAASFDVEQHHLLAGLPGGILGAPDQVDRGRGGRDLIRKEADHVALLGPHHASGLRGRVAELADNRFDPRARFSIHQRIAIYDARHGLQRRSGTFCNHPLRSHQLPRVFRPTLLEDRWIRQSSPRRPPIPNSSIDNVGQPGETIAKSETRARATEPRPEVGCASSGQGPWPRTVIGRKHSLFGQ